MERPHLDRITVLFWVSFVGGVASVCAFIASIALSADWQRVTVVGSSIIYILALLGIQVYLLTDRARIRHHVQAADEQLRQLEAYKCGYGGLHSITHAFRDAVYRQREGTSEPEALEEAFLTQILDNFTSVLTRITGVKCAAVLKAHEPNENVLRTLQRDSESKAQRGLEDHGRKVAVNQDTPAIQIIQGNQRHFFCNDLEQYAQQNDYRNPRADWQHWYLSTIVWPIRMYIGQSEKCHVVGLLSIDSMQKGRFDRACLEIGASIADLLYPYFTGILENTETGGNRQ